MCINRISIAQNPMIVVVNAHPALCIDKAIINIVIIRVVINLAGSRSRRKTGGGSDKTLISLRKEKSRPHQVVVY
jgi:hypothetical protein